MAEKNRSKRLPKLVSRFSAPLRREMGRGGGGASDFAHPYRARFLAAAEICTVLRVGTAVMLVTFLFCMLLFGHSQMKAENFRYLLKYVNGTSALDSSFYGGISFTGGENVDFALYKGDVCILDGTRFELWGISGRQVMGEDLTMKNPVLASGSRYLCLWESGGDEVRLYNSFGSVWEEKYSYPISLVRPADNGGFAVATSERGYRTAIYLYNDSFIHTYTWRSAEGQLVDFSLSPDGRYITVLTVGTENGLPCSDLIMLDGQKGSVILSEERSDSAPLGVRTLAGGTVCVVYEDSISCYDRKGTLKSVCRPEGDIIALYSGKDRVAVVAREENGSGYGVTVLDRSGKTVTVQSAGRVLSVAFREDEIILLSAGEAEVFRIKEKKVEKTASLPLSDGVRALLVLEDGALLACYGSYTALLPEFSDS